MTSNQPRLFTWKGARFGELTVTEIDLRMPRTATDIRLNRVGGRAVRVQCSCGDERLITLANLITYGTQRCRSCAQLLNAINREDSDTDEVRSILKRARARAHRHSRKMTMDDLRACLEQGPRVRRTS